MHFFSKTPSSSSLPSSPSVFSTKDNTNTNTNTNNCSSTAGNSWIARGQSFIKKLERQRKPRHVSEQDLGSNLTDRPKSPSGDRSRWVRFWAMVISASPEEGLNHVLRRNSTDQIATKVAKPSSNFRQRFSQHANVNSTSRDLRLKIQARSAPTSGFSSPSASPQRSNSANPFDSHVANKLTKYSGNTNRVRPTLNIPDLGRLASHSSQVPPVKTVLSPDHSPLRSPKLQSPCVDLENKCYSRSCRKLIQGSSKEWPENSCVSAHPRSAPISGLPSPATVSPRRSYTGDFLPSFVASQESQVRPTLKIPDLAQNYKVPALTLKINVILDPVVNCFREVRRSGLKTVVVYRGTNRVTGASCAMKEVDIIPGDLKSAESVKQLEQEIRVLRDLKHPNIVQYYGCEIVDEQFYIYLEYINPGSINKYVQEHCGHLPESIVRNFTRHILSGLAYLHSKKTVHRDIKGANLLVDASGVVKLTDFGTAKHLTGLSYELSLKGSPHWMAPEVIKAVMLKSDNPELALAVDTWSLGCTIIEMVTGKPPWGDLQGAQAMFKILNKDPPIPENLSPEGKDFLRCCFRRNPAERPSAMMLLDHPFVCKSNDLNVSACREAVPAVNPVDNLVSRIIQSERLKKMMRCKPPQTC
ncbi:hypothetical protein OIU77_009957 [Salix suchowensis]|uniref:Protein kinase domain-containing protein n=1 Tax=Salix suchowensis TaxID=1278906 RepID=A0ABQ9A6M3_9ROSI|nr:hypothetical protein OIU77_009957 [Salix suchowensis]